MLIRACLLAMLLASAVPAAAQPTSDELLEVERAWLDAYENNDREAMDRILAEHFLITYPDGERWNKQRTLDSLDPDAPGDPNVSMYTVDTFVRFFGTDTAVITGRYVWERSEPGGVKAQSTSLYTDTYKLIDGRWQVIASHLSEPPPESRQ